MGGLGASAVDGARSGEVAAGCLRGSWSQTHKPHTIYRIS